MTKNTTDKKKRVTLSHWDMFAIENALAAYRRAGMVNDESALALIKLLGRAESITVQTAF